MNTIGQAVSVAVYIADRHGDCHRFQNDYLNFRSNNGILVSLKSALEAQDLWNVFTQSCERDWLEKFYA